MKLSEKAFSNAIGSLANTLARQIETTCHEFEITTNATKKRIERVQYDFSFFRKTYFPHYVHRIQPTQNRQPISSVEQNKIFQNTISSDSSLESLGIIKQNVQVIDKQLSVVSVDNIPHRLDNICPISINSGSTTNHHRQLFMDHDSVLHRWLDETLPGILNNPKGQWLAIAAPRGEAKSTMVSLFFVIWAIITYKKHYILLIADTIEQSVSLLEAIKVELTSNPRLQQDFPESTGEGSVWNEGTIITCSNVKVQALSAGKRMRGLRHGAHRPDFYS